MGDQSPRQFPSVLDSPRFFDDAPMSAWELPTPGGYKAAAKNNIQLKQLWHGGTTDSEWPPPRNDSDPICIELVRGIDGVGDDSWSVIVDGLRCALTDKQTNTPYPVKSCKIPGGVKREFLTTETKVRSIVLGIRLEPEAERPSSAKLETLQKIGSDEMKTLDANENKIDTVSTVEILPYRTSEAVANVIRLPYPIRTPSKSILGIVSFEQVKRWEDKEIATSIFNAAVLGLNYDAERQFIEGMAIHKGLKEDAVKMNMVVDSISILSSAFAKDPRVLAGLRKVTRLTRQGIKSSTSLPKPTLPKQIRTMPTTDPPSVGGVDDTRTAQNKDFTIGGKSKSVARELADMFEKMTDYCFDAREVVKQSLEELKESESERDAYKVKPINDEKVKDYTGNPGKSLYAKLNAMRQYMLANESSTAVALFDALMTTVPFPPIKELLGKIDRSAIGIGGTFSSEKDSSGKEIVHLDKGYLISSLNFERRYLVCKDKPADTIENFTVLRNNEARIIPMTDKDRAEMKEFLGEIERNEAEKVVNEKDHPYAFLYDRLQVSNTKRTYVGIIYRVVVEDQDGSIFAVDFEAEEEDGIVANTVYSGHVKDIVDFDDAAEKFVDCMFASYTEGSTFNVGKTTAMAALDPRNVQKKLQRIPRGWKQFFKMFIGYLGDLSSLGRLLGLEKAFDACLIEERVAELKLMVRTMLPVWPPPPSEELLEDDRLVEDQFKKPETTTPPGPSTETKKPEPNKIIEKKNTLNPTSKDFQANTQKFSKQIRSLQQFFTESSKKLQYDRRISASMTDETELNCLQKEALEKLNTFKVNLNVKDIDNDTDIDSIVEELEAIVSELTCIQKSFDALNPARTGDDKELFSTTLVTTKRNLPQVLVLVKYPPPSFILPENPNPPKSLNYNIEEQIDKVKKTFLGNWKFSDFVKVAAGTGVLVWSSFAVLTFLAGNAAAAAAAGAAGAGGTVTTTATSQGAGVVLAGSLAKMLANLGLTGTPKSYLATAAVTQLLMSLRRRVGQSMTMLVLNWSQVRYTADQMRREFFKIALKNIRMVPVSLCIKGAKESMRLYSNSMKITLQELGVTTKQSKLLVVSYSNEMQERTQFSEYYLGSIPSEAKHVHPLHRSDDWTSIPSSSYMQVFPPSDVSDALFNAEVLRNIHMNEAVRFAVGKSPVNDAHTTPEMAAKIAFTELVQSVLRSRRELRGQNLMQSPSQVVLRLLVNASKLIKAAYGEQSGITLVTGDDAIWTCLAGGVAARLCMRHFNIFLDWEQKRTTYSSSTIKETIGYWSDNRRAMMDSFADALVLEASRYQKSEQQNESPLLYDVGFSSNRAIELVNSFERTASFFNDDGDIQVACTIVALAASAFIFPQIKDDWSNDYVVQMYQKINVYQESASTFRYQKESRGQIAEYSFKKRRAVWAKRRLETHSRRQLKIGKGVESLMKSLVDLNIESNDEPEGMVFYCPMGSDVNGYHTPYMFDVLTTGKHSIYIETLAETLRYVLSNIYLKGSIPSSTPDYLSVTIRASPMGENTTGYARHPLTLKLEGSTIGVQLSAHFPKLKRGPPFKNGKKANTLIEYIEFVSEMRDTDSIVNNRVSRMRSLAYNSERLFHAIALASSLESESKLIRCIDFEVFDSRDAISVAIALSIFSSQTGVTFPCVRTLVENELVQQSSVDAIQNAIEKIDLSLAKGCKYCFLSELCLSV